MPKTTFYNLDIQKKEKIENAIREELNKKIVWEFSIKSIVENANIPRGSFYQYFEDKDDAMSYIFEKNLNEKTKELVNLFNESSDLFNSIIDLYVYLTENINFNKNMLFHKNVFEYSRHNNSKLHDLMEEQLEEFKIIYNEDYLEKNKLKDLTEKEFKLLLKILFSILKDVSIATFSRHVSVDSGKQELLEQLEFLKKLTLKEDGGK